MPGNKKSSAAENKLDTPDLREWLDGKFNVLTGQNEKQEHTLNEINHRLEVLEGESFSAKEATDELKAENSTLRNEVESLKSQLEHLDAYQRRDNLCFLTFPRRRTKMCTRHWESLSGKNYS